MTTTGYSTNVHLHDDPKIAAKVAGLAGTPYVRLEIDNLTVFFDNRSQVQEVITALTAALSKLPQIQEVV